MPTDLLLRLNPRFAATAARIKDPEIRAAFEEVEMLLLQLLTDMAKMVKTDSASGLLGAGARAVIPLNSRSFFPDLKADVNGVVLEMDLDATPSASVDADSPIIQIHNTTGGLANWAAAWRYIESA